MKSLPLKSPRTPKSAWFLLPLVLGGISPIYSNVLLGDFLNDNHLYILLFILLIFPIAYLISDNLLSTQPKVHTEKKILIALFIQLMLYLDITHLAPLVYTSVFGEPGEIIVNIHQAGQPYHRSATRCDYISVVGQPIVNKRICMTDSKWWQTIKTQTGKMGRVCSVKITGKSSFLGFIPDIVVPIREKNIPVISPKISNQEYWSRIRELQRRNKFPAC